MGYSQDHLPVKAAKAEATACALLLVLCLGLCQTALGQGESSEVPRKLRQNTVRISASEDGFGFITGERGGFLYIATAKHVLGKDTPDSPMPKKAKVSFYSDQGETFDAEVLDTFEGDLAVLKVKKPAGFDWIRACLASPDAEAFGTKVWFVGRQEKWYVPPTPGAIASEQVSAKWELEIDKLGALPGTSGAPLVASSGIVGMVRTDAADTTRALVIEAIERSFKGWNHPWELTRAAVSGTVPAAAANPTGVETTTPSSSSGQPCTITVRTNPGAASVEVDDALIGNSPATFKVPHGHESVILVYRAGYQDKETSIKCVTSGGSKTIDLDLQQSNTIATNSSTYNPNSVPAGTVPARAMITLRYAGDLYSCRLFLTFRIGDKSITPNSNPVVMKNVPTGQQTYSVGGTIACPNAGQCVASGQGQLFIHEGGIYDVSWRNTAVGYCMVGLIGH